MLKHLLLALGLLLGASSALAQGVPISALPSATVPLTGSELMLVMQNGAAKKATVLQVGQAFNLGGTCTNCTLAGTTLNTGTISGGAISGAAITGGSISLLASPLPVASGGTGSAVAGATAANNIGALAIASNLSDLNSASAARTSLGLGTAALKAASDNTKATLASISGAITSGHIATFADTSGTVQDGGPAVATPVSLANGGTGAALTASNGGIVWSNASTLAILSGTATANQALLSGSSATPAWSTATYPPTTTINQLLYSSAANAVGGLATGNNGVLITSAGGVPSISSTLPSAVQANITSTGTIASGIWNGTAVDVAHGGLGIASGTSGGVPYYSSTSTIASSALLSASNPVIGGGAGVAPSSGARSGNTTTFATTSGALTNAHVAAFDASGNIVDGGAVSSGSVTLLSTLTASSSASLSDSTHITSTYKAYLIVFSNILPATNAVNFKIQFSTDGGATYLASGYQAGVGGSTYIGMINLFSSIGASGATQATVSNTATNGGVSGSVIFTNPNNTGGGNSVSGTVQVGDSTGPGVIGGNNGTTSVINGIQFSFSSGNIASGVIKIYGMS